MHTDKVVRVTPAGWLAALITVTTLVAAPAFAQDTGAISGIVVDTPPSVCRAHDYRHEPEHRQHPHGA
jgi:hypothetical protein